MKGNRILGRTVVGFFVVALASAAGAAEPTLQERVDALEKTVAEGKSDVLSALGLDFHALLSTGYVYSFNRPASGDLNYRVFDKKDNTFSVNDAALFISRQKEDEDFGFVLTFDVGDTARYTGRDWDGDGALTSSEETNYFEVREAYLTYKLPWADSTLKAGTFTTLLGYEVFKTPTNFNPNISNSILFGFTNPFTHTGLLLNTPLGEIASLDVGVVNGWDNFIDQNSSKTFLMGIGFSPLEDLATYTAFAYGSEQLPQDEGGLGAGSKRAELTMNAAYTVSDNLTLAIDTVYGNESELVSPTGQTGADWYGAALYAMIKANDWLGFSLRGEVFDDPDGARGFNATVWEITPTVNFQITEYLLARLEYRHDEANKQIFEKQDRFQRGSDTVAGELIVAF